MTERQIIQVLIKYFQGLYDKKKIKDWGMNWESKDYVFGTIYFIRSLHKYPVDCWEHRQIYETVHKFKDGKTFLFHIVILNNEAEMRRLDEFIRDIDLIVKQKKDEIKERAETCPIFAEAFKGYNIEKEIK